MKEETIREAISRVLLTEIGYDLDNAQVEKSGPSIIFTRTVFFPTTVKLVLIMWL